MANSKLTALDVIDSVSTEDIIYVVDDPSGSPISKKASIAQLISRIESTADHIIFKDSTGYHAYRTVDGTILYSHATDAADVINNLLSSLTLVYSPSSPDPYVRGTNETGFKEGRKIISTEGVLNCQQTLSIPPNQDLIIDFHNCIVNCGDAGFTDLVNIDSCMNSYFNVGLLVSASDVTTCLRLKPVTPGPDDQVTATTSKIIVEAFVGQGDGIVLDASSEDIYHIDIDINEVNLSSGSMRGLIATTGNHIEGCEVIMRRLNSCTNSISLGGTNVADNIFYIDKGYVDSGGATVVDSSGGRNIIFEANKDAQGMLSVLGRLKIVYDNEGHVAFIERKTSSTTGGIGVHEIIAQSEGNMADSFGPLLVFSISDTGATGVSVGHIGIVRDGADNKGKFVVYAYDGSTNPETFAVDKNAVAYIPNKTAPSASVTDKSLIFSADNNGSAGKAGLHFRNENSGNLIAVGAIIKTDTGDPAYNSEGLVCINTTDNTVKIYADGGWRTIASGW